MRSLLLIYIENNLINYLSPFRFKEICLYDIFFFFLPLFQHSCDLYIFLLKQNSVKDLLKAHRHKNAFSNNTGLQTFSVNDTILLTILKCHLGHRSTFLFFILIAQNHRQNVNLLWGHHTAPNYLNCQWDVSAFVNDFLARTWEL